MQIIKSHKNKLYVDHLREIIEVGFYLLNFLNPPKKEEYKDIFYYITFYHDLFKLTKEFQNYLNIEDLKKSDIKIKHAQLVGLLLYLNKDLLPAKYAEIIITICFSHHIFPDRIDSLKFNKYKDSLEELPKLVTEIKEYLNLIDFKDIKLNEIKDNFIKKNLKVKFSIINSLIESTSKKFSIEEYLDFLYLYAIFIIADRISASFNGKKDEFEKYYKDIIHSIVNIGEISEKNLEDYISELLKSSKNMPLSKLREEARKEALSNIDKNKSIFMLELPTGLGKTLISLNVALRIRNKEPIIYALPFLSIIEQTQQVLKKIYKDNVSTIHHLSPLVEEDIYENYSEDFIQKYLLPYKIKNITITTHERLRRMLFPYSRDDIILFPFLVNAIWIIDEIQLYPLDELYVLSKMIIQMTKQFKTKFIIMSATIPALELDDYCELIKDKEKYRLNRYKILNFNEKKDWNKIFYIVIQKLKEGKDVGILVNTIKESLNVYEYFLNKIEEKEKYNPSKSDSFILKILKNRFIYKEIKDILRDEIKLDVGLLINKFKIENEEVYLILLNGRIPSLYKRRIIKILNYLKEKKRRLLIISTQSLEAGVDIDLDYIFREIDTIDSIVQTAGRVNRNNTKEKGIVYLLEPEENSKYFENIKGIKYSWIKEFLDNNKIDNMEEKDIYEIIKKWYHFLKEYVIPKDSKKILKLIEEMNFKEIKEKLYMTPMKEYIICRGVRIEEILNNKLGNIPKKYDDRIKFFKQFSLNFRLLLLYKVDLFEDDYETLEKIKNILICNNAIL